MPDWKRRLGWALAALCALSLGLALAAAAQSREFSGTLHRINERKMVVDSGMGEKVRFRRTDATAVLDERPPRLRASPRESWEDLRVGDQLVVEWSLSDNPRRAYRVTVLAPRRKPGGELWPN